MEFLLAKNEENLNLKGRSAFLNDALYLDFTASGFEFCGEFNNSDVVIDTEISAENGLLGVIVDNDYQSMKEIPVVSGKQRITAYEKLNGKHTLKILKLLEYKKGYYIVKSLIFDGKILEKPDEKPLKFEFYGDSLTCGYGNLSTNRDTPQPFGFLEHGYRTWAALLSEKMGAEMSAVSSSGQGVLTDCGGNPEGTVFKYYDMAVPSYNVKWDFKKYQPDVVFIYLGNYDINYWRMNEKAEPDWAKFDEKSKKLLKSIKSNCPNSKIIYLLGHDSENKYYEGVEKEYKRLAFEYDNVYYCGGLSSNQNGGDWHPDLKDDITIYEKLYKFMCEYIKL